MACTINKVKHFYWYMVLATVVVLMWFLHSPKTMVKMIVAGSSASQHSSRDARVKRQLRPSSYMTEDINGGDEERVGFDLNLPAQSEDMIGALKIDEELEANMPKVDENAKSLFEKAGLLEWAKSMGEADEVENGKAAIVKLSELIDANGEDWVISMIAAAENVPAVKVFAQNLECALVKKWIDEKRDEDVAKMLVAGKGDMIDFLTSPALEIWTTIYRIKRKKIPFTLFDELSKYYTEIVLAEKLRVAQGNSDTQRTAKVLAKFQMKFWQHHGYSGDDVFELLGLNLAGINMFDRPLWVTWISYMKILSGKKDISTSKLILPVLRKRFDDDDDALFKWLADALKIVQSKQRVVPLIKALLKLKKPAEKEGEAPATTKRQRDDGEATAPTKRQRNGDGQ